MRHIFRGAALLVGAALLCSTLPADEKTTDNTDSAKPAPKAKKEKFEYSTKFDAKLTKLDSSTKDFTVQITKVVPDPQKVQDNNNHYAKRLAEISGERNPQKRQNRLLALQVDMQQRAANSLVKKTKNVDLTADDDMKVRVDKLPTENDDKGNPKKYTKAELKTLKGPDPDLPGYTADFDQLKVGQQVVVYLAKQKQEKAKTTKNSDDAEVDVTRPKAVMLLIVSDPSSARAAN